MYVLNPGVYTYGYSHSYPRYNRWLRGGTFAGLGDDAEASGTADAIAGAVSDMAASSAADAAANAIADAIAASSDAAAPGTAIVPEAPSAPQLPLEKHSIFDWGEMPSSVGTQVISIAAGLSGAIAAFVLSLKLRNATRIKTKDVALATSIGVIGAFVGVFFIRTYR
jgi:hypothetical protein